jgi:hypothetical protein
MFGQPVAITTLISENNELNLLLNSMLVPACFDSIDWSMYTLIQTHLIQTCSDNTKPHGTLRREQTVSKETVISVIL